MNSEQLFEKEFNKIQNFFNTQAKTENGYYRLYTVKTTDTKPKNNTDLRAVNFESESIEESLERLANDIKHYANTSNRFFVLKHYSAKTDPNPIFLYFANPYFDPTSQRAFLNNRHSINGMNNNSYNDPMFIDMMKDHYEQKGQLQDQIKELQHQRELDRLEDRIAGLEQGQKTVVDSVKEFLNSDVGQQIAGGIVGIFQAKMMQQPNPVQQNTPYQEPIKQPPQEESFEPQHKEDQEEQVQKVNQALVNLNNVFNGEGIDALLELSEFCINNPGLAHQFRKQNMSNNE
jgi:hypothetical protein